SRPHAAEPLRVSVAVSARRAVAVALDLRPEAAGATLVVHALRDATGTLPRLSGVVLETGERPRLRLSVPDDQPAGAYHGVVVDPRSGVAVGTVTVRIPA